MWNGAHPARRRKDSPTPPVRFPGGSRIDPLLLGLFHNPITSCPAQDTGFQIGLSGRRLP